MKHFHFVILVTLIYLFQILVFMILFFLKVQIFSPMKVLSLFFFFDNCNLIEAPCNDFDHAIYIESKYFDINDLNEIEHNKKSS